MPPCLRILALAALLAAAGCQSFPVVHAPPAPADDRAADVYLAHYDYYHTSLVVPDADRRGAVEYTYADWDVLARNHRTRWTKLKAILLPSRGTLGRAHVPWDGVDDASLLHSLDRCWKLSRYRVNADRLDRLTQRLDADFAAATQRGATERKGMRFGKAAQPYSLLNNCNHALRTWLKALGFRVAGAVPLADFQTPGAAHTHAPGREHGGMRTDFSELVGERPAPAPDTAPGTSQH